MAKHAAARRPTQIVHRAPSAPAVSLVRHTRAKPVTSSPQYLKLEKRINSLRKHSKGAVKHGENPMLVFAGAAVPALYQRFMGKPLPSVGGLDPELLAGGVLMGLSYFVKGHNKARLLALGAGAAAPAVNRAVKSGTVFTGGDDDSSDQRTSGDTDI